MGLPRRWGVPRLIGPAAMLVVGALLFGACSGGGYQYVHDSSTQTFFKLPQAWKTFDEGDLIPGEVRPNPFQQAGNPIQFLVGFSADPGAQAGDIPDPSSDQPQGFVLVHNLSTSERDQISLGFLRNAFVPIDQMYSKDPNSVAVFVDDENLTRDGFHGSHLVFSVRQSQDQVRQYTQSFTVNQTGLIDPATSKVYLLVILCTSDCYQKNQKTIDLVADSWSVREPS